MLDSKYSSQSSTKSVVTTVVASFVGILAALPVALSLFSPDGQAGALQDQATTTAEVAGVDANYAQYVHAYTQGLLASATTGVGDGSCVDPTAAVSVGGQGSVSAVSGASEVSVGGWGSGSVATPAVGGFGNAPARHTGGSGAGDWDGDVADSYNKYMSYVYNSAHTEVHNTNSNNVVGSHNSTSTDIKIEDSNGAHVDTTSSIETTNIAVDDSFNHDSYNTSTETNTTVVNDSFNKDTTLIIDSGNTTTEIETEIEDSYNDNSVETDVDMDIDVDHEVVNDSYNDTTIIKDNELEVEV